MKFNLVKFNHYYDILESNIKKHEVIVLLHHEKPDGDTLGAQISFKYFLKNFFPKKKIFTPCYEKDNSNFIIDYKFDKFNVFKHKHLKTLIIVFDCANFERLCGKELLKGNTSILVDHHIKNKKYTNISIIEETFSSCCELLSLILINKNFVLSHDISYYLLFGIVTDTERFLFYSKNTFFIVNKLLNYNVCLNNIYLKIDKYFNNNVDLLKIKKYILNNIITYKNIILYIKINRYIKEKLQFKPGILQYCLLEFIKSKKFKIIAWFTEDKKKIFGKDQLFIKGSLRSHKIDLIPLVKKFNGGGHKFAVGFKLKTWHDVHNFINNILFKYSKTTFFNKFWKKKIQNVSLDNKDKFLIDFWFFLKSTTNDYFALLKNNYIDSFLSKLNDILPNILKKINLNSELKNLLIDLWNYKIEKIINVQIIEVFEYLIDKLEFLKNNLKKTYEFKNYKNNYNVLLLKIQNIIDIKEEKIKNLLNIKKLIFEKLETFDFYFSEDYIKFKNFLYEEKKSIKKNIEWYKINFINNILFNLI